MKSRFLVLISLVLVFIIVLSACTVNSPETNEPTQEVAESIESESAEEVSETGGIETEESSEGISTEVEMTDYMENDIYGANFIDEVYAQNGENTVISPLSLNIAMAMMLEGAEGETKTEIERYLGTTKDSLDEYIEILLKSVIDKSDAKVIVSNAFWYMVGHDVNGDYLKTLRDRYAAEISDMDFSNPQNAAKVINAWCNEHTNGLIPQIVEESDVDGAEDVVVNTVYFKNNWLKAATNVVEGKFTGFDDTYNVEYFTCYEDTYLENDYAIGFVKPYAEKYSFVGILPKQEGEFTLAGLDIAGLMANRTTEFNVKAVMPKLNVESGGEVNNIFKKMGVVAAFGPRADFSGIARGIYISKIIHKTNIILDENGTEAAAATAVVTRKSAVAQPVNVKEVRLDRPYAFLIIDNETGSVLFSGKIVAF